MFEEFFFWVSVNNSLKDILQKRLFQKDITEGIVQSLVGCTGHWVSL